MTPGRGGDGIGVGCRQIFTVAIRAGKLKNWKSEKLTARTLSQIARISGFQDFRFSPHMLSPRIWPGDRGWGTVNGRFALKTGISCNAYINNHLTTGVDPKLPFVTFVSTVFVYVLPRTTFYYMHREIYDDVS